MADVRINGGIDFDLILADFSDSLLLLEEGESVDIVVVATGEAEALG